MHSITQRGWDEIRVCVCVWKGDSLTLVILLLGCGTDKFCLLRCNNAEISIQMGNGSVCWDVERLSFVFFGATKSSSLLKWETVQSVGMWNESVLSFTM